MTYLEINLKTISVNLGPGFGPESELESHLKETPTLGPICLIWTFV